MRKLLFPVLTGILFLSACTEKAPLINFGSTSSTDSTYIASSIPLPQSHNILIEEFTGASCSNCPAGAKQLHTLDSQYDGRINIVGLHIFGSLSDPRPESKYDFRTDKATSIGSVIYAPEAIAMPMAGIDRSTYDSKYLITRNYWPLQIQGRINIPTTINLDLKSNLDQSSGLATITVTTTYLQSNSAAQNITVVIVEDSIVDAQEFPFPLTDDSNYVFNHVFRDAVTIIQGDPVLNTLTQKESGRVLVRKYVYPLPADNQWKLEHCRVIAFIHSGNSADSKEVYQSAQCALK